MDRTDSDTCRELKEEILDAISKSKDTKTTFLHAERIDQAASRAYGIDTSDESNSTEQDSAYDVPVLAIDQGKGQTSAGTSLSLSVLSDGPGDEEKGAGDDDDSANWQLQRLDMSQFDLLQTISDDSFMKIAAHMQLQKSVSAFALVVIDGRPTEYSGPPTSTGAEPTPSFETNGTPYFGVSLDGEGVAHSESSASSMPSEPGNMEPGARSTAGSQRGGSGNHAQLPAANDERFRSSRHYTLPTRGTSPSDGGPESSTTGNPGTPPYGSPPEGIRRPAHQYSPLYSDDRRDSPGLTFTPPGPPSSIPLRTREEFPYLSSFPRQVSPRYSSSGVYATSPPPVPTPLPTEYQKFREEQAKKEALKRQRELEAELLAAAKQQAEQEEQAKDEALKRRDEREAEELLAAKQQLEQIREEQAKKEALERQRDEAELLAAKQELEKIRIREEQAKNEAFERQVDEAKFLATKQQLEQIKEKLAKDKALKRRDEREAEELLAAKQELEKIRIREEQAKKKALERQTERVAKARQEAEEIMRRKLQDIEAARKRAVMELERAKVEADQAARGRIEEERRTQEREGWRRKEERELGKAEAKREFEEERERARLKNRVMRALGWDKGAKDPVEVHDRQHSEK
jgi:hypothetical protein